MLKFVNEKLLTKKVNKVNINKKNTSTNNN